MANIVSIFTSFAVGVATAIVITNGFGGINVVATTLRQFRTHRTFRSGVRRHQNQNQFRASKLRDTSGGFRGRSRSRYCTTVKPQEPKNNLALIIRSNVNMGKGKLCAQIGHAAVSCYEKALKKEPAIINAWEKENEPKMVLRITSEKELYDLLDQAYNKDLVYCVIRDAGRTQLDEGTVTAAGIGPGDTKKIMEIVGHLKPL
uniref:peptidyl-tRNA hydrolase n=1 Tax=Clastoptera arizonana TaxID=38151 RepID=A0A1B6BZ53_9HEMI